MVVVVVCDDEECSDDEGRRTGQLMEGRPAMLAGTVRTSCRYASTLLGVPLVLVPLTLECKGAEEMAAG